MRELIILTDYDKQFLISIPDLKKYVTMDTDKIKILLIEDNPDDVRLIHTMLSEGKNGVYDKFRDRIMFPIHDRRGRVIAFGGRALSDDGPKYLNSPETALYHKSKELYGLYLARQRSGRARGGARRRVNELRLEAILLRRPRLSVGPARRPCGGAPLPSPSITSRRLSAAQCRGIG